MITESDHVSNFM